MALETTYMDFDQMKRVSEGFQDAAEVLNNVAKVMEHLMTVLKMTAFIGLVGGAVVERYLSIIKPRIEALGKQFQDLSEEINGAMDAFRQAQEAGNSI